MARPLRTWARFRVGRRTGSCRSGNQRSAGLDRSVETSYQEEKADQQTKNDKVFEEEEPEEDNEEEKLVKCLRNKGLYDCAVLYGGLSPAATDIRLQKPPSDRDTSLEITRIEEVRRGDAAAAMHDLL